MPLKRGDRGTEVVALQELLVAREFPLQVDGVFGPQTLRAVRAFQSQNLDQHGRPLTVDGVVGPLTWWSLNHARRGITISPVIDYFRMPPTSLGGSRIGRKALRTALEEMRAGAGESGGNNRGPYVRKYLNGLAPEGSNWCAGFVSWCFSPTSDGNPFRYTVSARDLLNQLRRKHWDHKPGVGYVPVPGDIVVWWRERADGWQGHVGIVHHAQDGMLYTIEGNRSSKVAGFDYVLSRMERLLGFGHIPD